MATTNTYAVHRDRLTAAGLDLALEDLVAEALRSARDARSQYPTRKIAGSLGPLVGSYRPEACPPPEVASRAYSELVDLMKDQVDLFIVETVSSVCGTSRLALEIA